MKSRSMWARVSDTHATPRALSAPMALLILAVGSARSSGGDIVAPPPPDNIAVAPWGGATIAVVAGSRSDGSLQYQWLGSGFDIDSARFELPSAETDDHNALYSVLVSNAVQPIPPAPPNSANRNTSQVFLRDVCIRAKGPSGCTPLFPQEIRASSAIDNVEDTRQYAVAYRLQPHHRLRARHLELATGIIATTRQTNGFVSFGPVWQLPLAGGNNRWHVQLGFSPTLLTGSTVNDRDLGGKFHFTSSASLGAAFGKRRSLSIALRIQHTSNGGINSQNPGLDMLGFSISFDPAHMSQR